MSANAFSQRLFLMVACFVSGAAMMVIEICAFRLLAPVFGNSVYTWTALIGVVLVSFSAGGWLGGCWADRLRSLRLLAWLLLGSAAMTALVPSLHAAAARSLGAWGMINGSVALSLLLFALPGAMLGAVSPAAVRLLSLAAADARVGVAAGTISSLGSLGSFLGTFLSGFVLLSHFGVRSIFLGTALVLLVLGLWALWLEGSRGPKLGMALLAGGLGSWFSAGGDDLLAAASAPGQKLLHVEESFYHRIEVSDLGEEPRVQRLLKLDSTAEGAIHPRDGSLVMDYQHYWQLPLLREGQPLNSALFLGAGAFGMPAALSRQLPQAQVEVVEIDPRVIEVGRRFFRLDEHPRVKAHAQDARRFLGEAQGRRWDLIFGDAYAGVRSIPAHLVTREFFAQVAEHLTPTGVFVMNAITAVQGPESKLLASLLATLRQVFAQVEVFAVQGGGATAQNVIVLAAQQSWSETLERYQAPGSWQERLLQTRMRTSVLPGQGLVFTDDFNPVDRIIAEGLAAQP